MNIWPARVEGKAAFFTSGITGKEPFHHYWEGAPILPKGGAPVLPKGPHLTGKLDAPGPHITGKMRPGGPSNLWNVKWAPGAPIYRDNGLRRKQCSNLVGSPFLLAKPFFFPVWTNGCRRDPWLYRLATLQAESLMHCLPRVGVVWVTKV